MGSLYERMYKILCFFVWACICTDNVYDNTVKSYKITTKPASTYYEQNGPFYWKIGKSNQFSHGKMQKIIFQGYPICIIRKSDETRELQAISDICLHRAASLSQGRVLSNGCIQCPYHGWEFRDGLVETIPGCPKDESKPAKIGVPRFSVKEINNDVFMCPTYDMNTEQGLNASTDIHIPREATDDSFRRVSGRRHIRRPHHLVTENVLDMMHVSFVHSFGNRLSPVPFKIKYNDLDEYSGKTTFHYTAGSMSMSSLLGNAQFVKVENEFYLPDVTVTRVFANDIVKTIVTHCYPIGKNESILHYDLYRNFLDSPVFDSFFRYQMERTLDEDVEILNSVYDAHMSGFMNTKFDVTQVRYRKKWKDVLSRKS